MTPQRRREREREDAAHQAWSRRLTAAHEFARPWIAGPVDRYLLAGLYGAWPEYAPTTSLGDLPWAPTFRERLNQQRHLREQGISAERVALILGTLMWARDTRDAIAGLAVLPPANPGGPAEVLRDGQSLYLLCGPCQLFDTATTGRLDALRERAEEHNREQHREATS